MNLEQPKLPDPTGEQGHQHGVLKSLWLYRAYIVNSIQREFQLRYQSSLFGAAWTVINPLVMIVIYTVIFSQVMKARLPDIHSEYAYSIFLMSGLLPWGLFLDMVQRGPNLFLDQANLLKKVQFPKLSLLLISMGSSLVNFVIIYGLFLIFLIISGQFPGWVILSVLPVLLLQICLAVSLALALAVLNVFFRDVGQLTNITIQLGFWLTPILYSKQMVPERYQHYLALNPLTNLFEAYHDIFMRQQMPQWDSLLPACIVCVVTILIASHLFHRRSAEMMDEL